MAKASAQASVSKITGLMASPTQRPPKPYQLLLLAWITQDPSLNRTLDTPMLNSIHLNYGHESNYCRTVIYCPKGCVLVTLRTTVQLGNKCHRSFKDFQIAILKQYMTPVANGRENFYSPVAIMFSWVIWISITTTY